LAGGGGGGGGGCSAGGGVCDDACGTNAVVTASAVTKSTTLFKAFIRPPIRFLCSGRNASGEATILRWL
jgi:hypothetical protein